MNESRLRSIWQSKNSNLNFWNVWFDFLNSTIKTIGGNENANQFVTAGSKGATGNGVYEKTVKYPFKGYVALIKLPTSLL